MGNDSFCEGECMIINPAFIALFVYLALGALITNVLTKTHKARNVGIFFVVSIVLFYLVAFLLHVVGAFE